MPKSKVTNKNKTPLTVRRQILNMAETKVFSDSAGVATQGTNTIWGWSPTQSITVGSGSNRRTGDEIFIKSVHISGNVSGDSAQNAHDTHRIIVYFSDQEVASSGWSLGFNSNTLALNNTDLKVTNMITDNRKITVISDNRYHMNNDTLNAREEKIVKLDIPINKKFVYHAVNGVYGKKHNLYVVWMCSSGLTGVNAGAFSFGYAVKFKDI